MSSSASARGDAMVLEQASKRTIEWGAATRPHPEEAVSGDAVLVTRIPDGMLVAAIDGVGRGPEAAAAATVALEAVRGAAGADLVAIVRLCHRALTGTRGAALALAFLSTSTSTLTWLGIGSVAGRLVTTSHARPNPSLRGRRGVLGHQLPALGTATLDVRYGDVLILATDGIAGSFAEALDLSGSPAQIAERILAEHWNVADDALVLMLRYLAGR